jgi:hypothetical protein
LVEVRLKLRNPNAAGDIRHAAGLFEPGVLPHLKTQWAAENGWPTLRLRNKATVVRAAGIFGPWRTNTPSVSSAGT